MAEDIARLGLEIDSKDVKKATKELDHLEKQGKKTEGTTRRMTGGFSAMGGAIAALGVGLVVREIISINAEFSKLHGALVTVTGSTEAANDVVDRMKTLMTEVPGNLNDLTSSFIKLKALGLDPSEKAIIAYSNVAAAMGKDLNQMIEAVADAATGEFERLKEFGIKAASEGDRVKFTFQGVTKEVGKNSQEIQDYLLAIGETQFAGAAAKQIDTFGGALDNVGSQLSALLISDDGLPGATNALKELADVISDPSTKEGMDGLIAGVAKLVEWSAKGAIGFADFGKELGIFAAQAAGSNIPSIKEMEARVSSLSGQLATARQQQEKYNAALAAGKSENWFGFAGGVKDQTEEIEKLTAQLGSAKAMMDTIKQPDMQAPSAVAEAQPTIVPDTELSDKEKERLKDKLESLKDSLADETEAALRELIKRQTILTELEDTNIGTEEERRALRLEATQEYEEALLEIAQDRIDREQKIKDDASKREEERVRKNTAFAIRMAESGNKDATALLKGYLLDQAKMLGQTAIVGAYKWGAAIGGPIAGAAAAAVASLAVGTLISGIDDGGGGGGGGAAGGGSTVGEGGGIGEAPQGIQQAAEPQEKVVRFPDLDPDSFMTVKGMFKLMNEATDRGYKFEVG